jgi:hypothetical protein
MNWLHRMSFRLRALFRKRELDGELDAELRFHVENQIQANIQAGMSAEEARYAALRKFGWVESIKETCRDVRGVNWIEDLCKDVRFGLRLLLRNPAVTVIAVSSLAIDQ